MSGAWSALTADFRARVLVLPDQPRPLDATHAIVDDAVSRPGASARQVGQR